jgi:hypothetical protein
MSNPAEPASLQPETLAAYGEHLAAADADLSHSLEPDGLFLWSEQSPDRAAAIRKGQAVADMWAGKDPIHVPGGLVHDWVGATWIAGGTIANVLALVQSYDQHKDIYAPDVVGSTLLSRSGDVFDVYLRLRKKKVKTVVLDTDHHVEYFPVHETRWYCRSHTTRVAEVENAGKEGERVGEPDTGYGYLWRLSSYWRFDERDGGVWVECRAISLTRDVPTGLGWIVDPIVKRLPRESLLATLEATRRGYAARFGSASGLQ